MIETTIRNYLISVQGVPVLMDQQAGMDEVYIIEKTGGGERNHIRTAMLAIQSYAKTKARAAQLCEDVIAYMMSAVTLDEVASVSLNSAYDYTDTASKSYRYQAVFDITHY